MPDAYRSAWGASGGGKNCAFVQLVQGEGSIWSDPCVCSLLGCCVGGQGRPHTSSDSINCVLFVERCVSVALGRLSVVECLPLRNGGLPLEGKMSHSLGVPSRRSGRSNLVVFFSCHRVVASSLGHVTTSWSAGSFQAPPRHTCPRVAHNRITCTIYPGDVCCFCFVLLLPPPA